MFDALVVGAGPAGSSTAFHMSRAGLDVLLVDASGFPRDKVCADVVSRSALERLSAMEIVNLPEACACEPAHGLLLASAMGTEARFSLNPGTAAAYICSRRELDAVLVDRAVSEGVTFWEHSRVTELLRDEGRVVGAKVTRLQAPAAESGDDRYPRTEEVRAPLVVGADGTYSVVARELRLHGVGDRHLISGLRGYFEGVSPSDRGSFIEIHLLDYDLPAYLWLMPLPAGRVNVGAAMLTSDVRRHHVQLRDLMLEHLELPHLRDRFQEANGATVTKAWSVPISTATRPTSGDGWILVGDAAAVADPLTGEGIANALLSGEIAARVAAEAVQKVDFSADQLKSYSRALKKAIEPDQQISERLRRLGNWRWFRDAFIARGNRSPELAHTIAGYLDEDGRRRKLASPLFLMRLLTTR